MSSECIFCRIAEGQMSADLIHEDEEILAFRDINPQAPIHILVMPRVHIPTLNDLSESQAGLIGRMHLVARDLAAQEGIAEAGYRTLINCNAQGGQAVFHIHLHLLGGRRMQWPPG